MKKKGISTVVATVLVLMITVIAVAVVAAFIIPAVKNWLKGSDCFETLDKIRIDENSGYTCFVAGEKTTLTIERKDIDIGEIFVSISYGGDSKGYRIKDNEETLNVKMMNSLSTTLKLPGKGEKKTYVFEDAKIAAGSVVSAQAVAVLNNKICESSDKLQIQEC